MKERQGACVETRVDKAGQPVQRRLHVAWLAMLLIASAGSVAVRIRFGVRSDAPERAHALATAAARQQWRSEHVRAVTLASARPRSGDDAGHRSELEPAVRALRGGHRKLVHGCAEDAAALRDLRRLEALLEAMETAQLVLDGPAVAAPEREAAVDVLAERARRYSAGLEALTAHLSEAAVAASRRRAETVLLADAAIVCLLLLFGLVAVEPALRAVRRRIRELEERSERADAGALAKSAMLANTSHEVRTAMAAMLGNIELLEDRTFDAAERQEALRTIRANGERVLSVLDDTLDLARLGEGRLDVDVGPVELLRVFDDLLPGLGERATVRGNRLTLTAATPLPAVVASDALRLRQCLGNLAGAAIEVTHGGAVDITVGCDPAAGSLTVDVRGRGEAPHGGEEGVDRLFEAFARQDPEAPTLFSGPGLALTLARALARRLGGDLTVRRIAGRESLLHFTLPTGPLDGVARIDPGQLTGRVATPPELSESLAIRGRVLLVDDVEDNRRLYGRMVAGAGAELQLASDGAEAVRLATQAMRDGRSFDLVLMDVQMPILDGYRATRALREAGYTGPIVALTAHALPRERQRCLEAGCDGYLPKPVRRAVLLNEIAQRLGA